VLVLVLGLASSGVWFAQQRAARLAETERTVTKALAQAEVHLQEGDKQMEQPERWQATARQAQLALEKAEELLATGVATEELAARVRQIRAEVDAAVTDSRLLVRLDSIRLEQAAVNVKEDLFDLARAAPLFAEVLGNYGVNPAVPEAAAARVRDSRLREALLGALADWERVTRDPQERQRVVEVQRLVQPPDTLWARLLEAARRRDGGAFVKLAKEPACQDLPAVTLSVLVRELEAVKEWRTAERLLRAALERKPADFWLNHQLGKALLNQKPPQREEAVRYLTVALALRSDDPGVHLSLGDALFKKGDLDGADRRCRSALQIDPEYAAAHLDLGVVLHSKGLIDEAIAEYLQAIRLKKDLSLAHAHLGIALAAKGRLDDAMAAFREALRIDPENVNAHLNLGKTLSDKGELDKAIAEYRKALQLDPGDAVVHCNLGKTLRANGQLDEGIAEYRAAIRLKPEFALAHCNLGHALRQRGEFREALEELRRGHELGSKNPGWSYPSAQWVGQCERLVELDGKLAEVLSGHRKPADSGERLNFAWLCQQPFQKRYAAAARFYDEAFTEKPQLANALNTQHRYNAACAAALAAAGQGKDADNLDNKERIRLRRQSLDWLRADLALWTKQTSDGQPQLRIEYQRKLEHWQQDSDFASVRGETALAKLPADEQPGWRQLWADVEKTLTKLRQENKRKEKSAKK
jgi:tetratricopeptide (TPR) repeat protein